MTEDDATNKADYDYMVMKGCPICGGRQITGGFVADLGGRLSCEVGHQLGYTRNDDEIYWQSHEVKVEGTYHVPRKTESPDPVPTPGDGGGAQRSGQEGDEGTG